MQFPGGEHSFRRGDGNYRGNAAAGDDDDDDDGVGEGRTSYTTIQLSGFRPQVCLKDLRQKHESE